MSDIEVQVAKNTTDIKHLLDMSNIVFSRLEKVGQDVNALLLVSNDIKKDVSQQSKDISTIAEEVKEHCLDSKPVRDTVKVLSQKQEKFDLSYKPFLENYCTLRGASKLIVSFILCNGAIAGAVFGVGRLFKWW